MARVNFTVQLPDADPNVASRELTVTVAGGKATLHPVGAKDSLVKNLHGNDGDAVELSLVPIDKAGKKGTPVTYNGTLSAGATAAPGQLGITVVP